MSTHTPGPWKLGKSCDGFLTVTDGSKTICTIGEADLFPEIEQDAAFIVRACNSHEAMLEALKDLLDYAVDPVQFTQHNIVMFIDKAEEAIRLAEGRP